MTKCKDCKHFLPEAVSGNCKAGFWNIGYGDPTDLAGGVDVEGDEGWGYRVTPDFGCIHGEAK